MSTLEVATVKATTLEETTSGDTVTAAALMNPWEFLGTDSPSAASGLEFFHDGWEGTGSAAFIDGWEYRIIGNIYGSSAGAYLQWKTYEPTVRESASDYATIWDGYGSSSQQGAGTQAAFGTCTQISWGTDSAHSVHMDIHFRNAGSTAYPLLSSALGNNELDSGVIFAAYCITRLDDAGGTSETLASSKIDLIPSGGTFTGDLALFRRKIS